MQFKHIITPYNITSVFINHKGDVKFENPGFSDNDTYKQYFLHFYKVNLEKVKQENDKLFGTILYITTGDNALSLVHIVNGYEDNITNNIELKEIKTYSSNMFQIYDEDGNDIPETIFIMKAGTCAGSDEMYYYYGHEDAYGMEPNLKLNLVSESALLNKYKNVKGFKLPK